MFNRGFRLPFKLLGIPIYLDWSFLIILPILAYLIGSNIALIAMQFDIQAGALADPTTRYVIGLVAALGLFVCVLLHELGHAVAARLYGVNVERITLWFLGGVAQMPEIPRQRGGEAVMAIAGPIVSFLLAALFWFALPLVPEAMTGTRFVVGYLAVLNVVLAVFNLLPALPLDGGRVLRSLLALAMPFGRATQIAGGISKVIAVLLGIWGILTLNIFLMAIAFFIYMAVNAETQMGRLEAVLRGVPAWRIMNPEVHSVTPNTRVSELLQRMLRDRHLGFPVIDEIGRVHGMVTLDQLNERDPATPVSQLMSTDLPRIDQDADGLDVLRQMGQNHLSAVVVIGPDDRVAGIITKSDLMRFIMVREAIAGLHIQPPTRPIGAPWAARTA